jgi:hypothetical protein
VCVDQDMTIKLIIVTIILKGFYNKIPQEFWRNKNAYLLLNRWMVCIVALWSLLSSALASSGNE